MAWSGPRSPWQVVRAAVHKASFSWVLVFSFIFEAFAQDLSDPVLSNPRLNSTDVPPRLLSVVVTFAEDVATGSSGTLSVLSRDGVDVFQLPCSGGLLVSGRSIIAPLPSALRPDKAYIVELHAACVLAADGSGRTLAEDLQIGEFATASEGGSVATMVEEVGPALDASVTSPLARPQPGTYVFKGHVPFSLQFTETVSRGTGSLRWFRQGYGPRVLYDVLDVSTASSARVYFDPNVPGRVILASRPLQDSGEYSIEWDAGVFLDSTGQAVQSSPYSIYLGSQLLSMYPREATLPRDHQITAYTNLVLEFDDIVRPGQDFDYRGDSGVYLCRAWRSGTCSEADTLRVPAAGVHFLGKTVLVNPPGLLDYYTEYQLFVSSNSFLFFSGIDTQTATPGVWSFRTVVENRREDLVAPVLVAVRPDCNRDGEVGTQPSSNCTVEGHEEGPPEAEQLLEPAPMLPLDSQFFVYFQEAMNSTGVAAELVRHHNLPGLPFAHRGSVGIVNDTWPLRSAMNGSSDCVAIFRPVMEAGASYTLNIGANALTDRFGNNGLGVPFEGVSFSFSTPLGRPVSTVPPNRSGTVYRTVALQVTFAGYPEPANPGTGEDLAELVDDTSGTTRRFAVDDLDQVRFQGNNIRVVPNPGLEEQHSYTFRLLHNAILFLLEDVVLKFSTQQGAGPPATLQYTQPNENEPAPSSSDIILYFSEALYKGEGLHLIYVVEDGSPHRQIPVDNSAPAEGIVTVLGQTALITPRLPLTPGRQVEVHFRNGTFVDSLGDAIEGVGFFTSRPPIRFTVSEPVLQSLRPNTTFDNETLPTLDSADLHWVGGQWQVLFGQWSGTCLPRLFSSVDGVDWQEAAYVNLDERTLIDSGGTLDPTGKILNGATSAVDEQGCLVLLGVQCGGLASNTLWRSCDGGSTWEVLPEPVPTQTNGTTVPTAWPRSFQGHAMVIVGGWRLVVADAPRQVVWTFLDASMTAVESWIPSWSARFDPLIAATGSGLLVLLGGTRCEDAACSQGMSSSHQDVWSSNDAGRTWTCLDAGGQSRITAARGHTSLVALLDNSLLLLNRSDATTQFLEADSEPALLEDLFEPPRLLMRFPAINAQDVEAGEFKAVIAYSSSIRLPTLDPETEFASLTHLGDQTTIPVVASVTGAVLVLAATQPLPSGTQFRLAVHHRPLGLDGRQAAALGTWSFGTALTLATPAEPPQLQTAFPPSEDSTAPTFTWSTSRPILLTFQTLVLPGTATVQLTGRVIGQNVTPQLVVAGRQVAVVAEGLLPGEVYQVVLEAGALLDTLGRPCGAASWTLSFAPLLRFQNIRDSSGPLEIPNSRWGSAVSVNDANEVLILGGMTGAGKLNDVWSLRTGRHVHCASSLESPGPCSQSNCSGEPASMGTGVVRKSIWRAPSSAGRPCVDNLGVAKLNLGNLLDSWEEECDCPRCFSLPTGPFPTHMATTDFGPFLLAQADVDLQPLACLEGYQPTGDFRCNASSRFFGEWAPFPECLPAACGAAPWIEHLDPKFGIVNVSACTDCSAKVDKGVEDVNATNATNITDDNVTAGDNSAEGNNTEENNTEENMTVASPSLALCGSILPATNTSAASAGGLVHDEACLFGCMPGYQASGPLSCSYGRYAGTCLKRACPRPRPGAAGDEATLNCGDGQLLLGSQCQLQCKPGWLLEGLDQWLCVVQQANASGHVPAEPDWAKLGTCVKRVCGIPPGKLDRDLAQLSGATGNLLGSLASYDCAEGYQLSALSDEQMRCDVDNETEGTVSWQGNIICEKRPCLSQPTVPLGTFECVPGDGLLGDKCQLRCPIGFKVDGGNGSYICDGDTYVADGTCVPQACGQPPLVTNAVGLDDDCVGSLRHGHNCRVICRAAHVAVGRYSCMEGVLIERPACVFLGMTALAQYAVEAVLRAEVRGGSISGNQLQVGTKAALQAGLQAVGLAYAVSQVRTAIEGRGRRLGHNAPLRQLQTSAYLLTVTWQTSTPDNIIAADVSQALLAPSNKANFHTAFAAQLRQELGLEVDSMEIASAMPVVWYEPPATTADFLDRARKTDVPLLTLLLGVLVGLVVAAVAAVFTFLLCQQRYRHSERRSEKSSQDDWHLELPSEPPPQERQTHPSSPESDSQDDAHTTVSV